jgi:hypothetical protein
MEQSYQTDEPIVDGDLTPRDEGANGFTDGPELRPKYGYGSRDRYRRHAAHPIEEARRRYSHRALVSVRRLPRARSSHRR